MFDPARLSDLLNGKPFALPKHLLQLRNDPLQYHKKRKSPIRGTPTVGSLA